jgi:predicted pyridoxine 5'-phosphate oxidase superfamily flavin-nucleotide-binding protein
MYLQREQYDTVSAVSYHVAMTRRSRTRHGARVVPAELSGLELCAGPEASEPQVEAPSETPSAEVSAMQGLVDPMRSVAPAGTDGLPGSAGEHLLQCAFGSEHRARRFYGDQVLTHLNQDMVEFIRRMEMLFIATADGRGECDASLRAGPAGFLQVVDARHVAYPEYRGNGVMASLGNISENSHIGLLMVDFVTDLIGLHVNGRARIIEDADLRAAHPALPSDHEPGRVPERWVVVEVEEAYIHCRKHIPRMVPVSGDRAWGTDDMRRKGGDYFGAKSTPSPWKDAFTPETVPRRA